MTSRWLEDELESGNDKEITFDVTESYTEFLKSYEKFKHCLRQSDYGKTASFWIIYINVNASSALHTYSRPVRVFACNYHYVKYHNFPHQKIRWNYVILCSVLLTIMSKSSYAHYGSFYLKLSFQVLKRY